MHAEEDRLSISNLTLGQISLGIYILSITLLPLGFGGNRDIPFGLCQIGLAVSAMLLILEKSMLRQTVWPKEIKVSLVLFGIVLVWGFLQTQSFMPSALHNPLWQYAAKALQTPLDGSIALWRNEAFFAINRIITYIAAGILAYILGRDPAHARLMLQAMWYSGIALCMYGYFNVIIGSTKVLWVDKTQYEYDLTSTFISKNHFGIYAAMVMLCGTALLYQSWRNNQRHMKDDKKALEHISRWFTEKAYFQFLLICYVFGAIVLSNCRAALILSLIGAGAYLVFYQVYARAYKHAIHMIIVAACVTLCVMLIAEESSEHFARLFVDKSARDRLNVYGLCFNAIADNPWLGYGLGSFQAVYRLYNTSNFWSFNHAHSDILESLVDLGIPVGIMLWCALALLFASLARGILRRRRHGMFPAIGLATTLVIIVHSSMDFSLQIPGVAMPYAMILGMALSQSWSSSEKTT